MLQKPTDERSFVWLELSSLMATVVGPPTTLTIGWVAGMTKGARRNGTNVTLKYTFGKKDINVNF